VLLLEAGPPDTNPWIHVPLGYTRIFTAIREAAAMLKSKGARA